MTIDDDFNTLSTFLARRDIGSISSSSLSGPIDFIVLLGSSLLITTEVAVQALREGVANRVLVSGGIGHSTSHLIEAVKNRQLLPEDAVWGKSEAEILTEIMVLHYGIDRDSILLETRSTNCGANAYEVKRTLQAQGLQPERLLLIQDPTMQRRTHASFERAWRGEVAPEFLSFAPFIPRVVSGAVLPAGQWSWERFVSLTVGEIPRLLDTPLGYGPSGKDFIEHVEIHPDVLEAHSRIVDWTGLATRD